MTISCHFCGEPVDPLARDTFRRVVGWEKKALAESRKGGSDIVLREPVADFAHPACIALVQNGVSPKQVSLLEPRPDYDPRVNFPERFKEGPI